LVHSFHWTHNELSYVNLEDLQTYSHISSSIPVCSQPDSNNNTVLDLRFTNYPAYVAAKRAWSGRDDLLMVIEDESCFEGKNLRSVYRYVYPYVLLSELCLYAYGSCAWFLLYCI
jgi:hypothetical protein